MKRTLIAVILTAFLAGFFTFAQTQQVASPTGQKTLAATMNVYVFPTGGQTSEQQAKNEGECYNWAVQNTGTDPFQLAKQAELQKQQSAQAEQQAKEVGTGAGATGAVRGAARGALIGEIANDDPGKGAAYGAAAGLIRGRRRGRAAQQGAMEDAEKRALEEQQQIGQQMENFKKAFSVCLEAKNYLVKY